MKFIDITVTGKGSINYMIPCSDRDVANYCGKPIERRRAWDREKEESVKDRMKKRKASERKI